MFKDIHLENDPNLVQHKYKVIELLWEGSLVNEATLFEFDNLTQQCPNTVFPNCLSGEEVANLGPERAGVPSQKLEVKRVYKK